MADLGAGLRVGLNVIDAADNVFHGRLPGAQAAVGRVGKQVAQQAAMGVITAAGTYALDRAYWRGKRVFDSIKSMRPAFMGGHKTQPVYSGEDLVAAEAVQRDVQNMESPLGIRMAHVYDARINEDLSPDPFPYQDAVNPGVYPTWCEYNILHPMSNPFTGYTCVNEVVKGYDIMQRTGSRIILESVSVRMHLHYKDVTVAVPTPVRWALVYDKQPNVSTVGHAPTIGEIFSVSSIGVGFYAGVNLYNRDRFVVLRDQFLDLDPAKNTQVIVNEYVKCFGLVTNFNGLGAVVGSITSGCLYFFCYSYYGQSLLMNTTIRVRFRE